MVLSMEYGDFKPHEAAAFELDHMIAYKKSLKFNSRNVLMEVNLKNFLPRKLPAIRYTTNVPHLWLGKIFTLFQQEFTINNNRISHQQLNNEFILLQLYRIFGFTMYLWI